MEFALDSFYQFHFHMGCLKASLFDFERKISRPTSQSQPVSAQPSSAPFTSLLVRLQGWQCATQGTKSPAVPGSKIANNSLFLLIDCS